MGRISSKWSKSEAEHYVVTNWGFDLISPPFFFGDLWRFPWRACDGARDEGCVRVTATLVTRGWSNQQAAKQIMIMLYNSNVWLMDGGWCAWKSGFTAAVFASDSYFVHWFWWPCFLWCCFHQHLSLGCVPFWDDITDSAQYCWSYCVACLNIIMKGIRGQKKYSQINGAFHYGNTVIILISVICHLQAMSAGVSKIWLGANFGTEI